MRQHHVAGDKVFADCSDRETGEVRPAQLFIAVLGASNYTHAAGEPDVGAARLDQRPG
jgi:transposase